jgi:hypothetical protein
MPKGEANRPTMEYVLASNVFIWHRASTKASNILLVVDFSTYAVSSTDSMSSLTVFVFFSLTPGFLVAPGQF